MRKLLLALAAVALTLAQPAWGATVLSAKTANCAAEQQAPYTPVAQRYERGLIFRIERCGYPASFIMGTLHSDSPKLLTIYNDAIAILKGMRAVGFEFVENDQTAVTAAQYMFLPSSYPGGLHTMIPVEHFEALAVALQKRLDMPRQTTDRLRPWAAAIMLQYPPPVADGVVLDKRLQDAARATQKSLFSLESPAEQFRIFDAIPMEKQLTMLRDSIVSLEKMDESNADFMQAYINRDLKTLHRLADTSFALTSDHTLRVYIEEELLTKRNQTMARRLVPHLKAGNTLTAIGALHLLGRDGILASLEAEGWRVEPVR